MRTLFLSYRFRPEDSPWANEVKRLVESHSLECVTGEDLGGEPVWDEVSKRVGSSDALIAMFLHPLVIDNYHAWVQAEYNQAIAGGRRAIALVQDGFPFPNPQGKEFVKLDPNAPLSAFLKLSKTIGDWRRAAGRTVLIRLTPPMVARVAREESYTCRYRVMRNFDVITNWSEVKPERSGRDIGFQVSGVPDDVRIEIELTGKNGAAYFSVADPQFLTAELEQDGARG